MDGLINWQSFWSAVLGAIPGLIVALLVLRVTTGFSRSLEKLKGELQQDVIRFTKWHEKRVEAFVAIYVAFTEFLDFLRKDLYFSPRSPMTLEPLHEFHRAITTQIVFLDDELAEKVLRYQGELHYFRNDVYASGKIGSEETKSKLDYEIPAYLPRLRRTISSRISPDRRCTTGTSMP